MSNAWFLIDSSRPTESASNSSDSPSAARTSCSRTPRRRFGGDAVVDDVRCSVEGDERLEPERRFCRDRRDSPRPARTPAIRECAPARLAQIAPVLREDEVRPVERRAGDRRRKPRAALRVDDGRAESAKPRDQANGQSGDAKGRISTIPDRDSRAAKRVRMNPELAGAEDPCRIPTPRKRPRQIGDDALQTAGSEPGQDQGDARASLGAPREHGSHPRSIWRRSRGAGWP